ncbi:flagellar hook-basal body complex protein [Sphingomonas colocasiae]|uniref:Flagellar hook protein FlgE n=1 Tax=Sphingomonas colocasiae TaxID=1848973 RepID=A0ABS7PW25_9SPHN|nr:flagellar hook-basal body complex protein [Sphingomonas colocasiae]MBY8825563.1 flagellar hook-basal body complex protein [Sphingomonas colocasiae]
MLGSIYVGLSGLQAYSKGLQQVSNNVANLNSQGFRSSVVTFSNLQSSRESGGIGYSSVSDNPSGGVALGQSMLDFTPGQLRQTTRDLDLAVDGSGFLVLMRGSEIRYARTGSFEVNEDGYVTLQGTDWRLATLDASGRAVSLSVDNARTSAPEKTTKIAFADNLSSTATTHSINNIKVYGANGEEHVWKIDFSREETSTDWTVKVTDEKDRVIGEKTLSVSGSAPTSETNKLLFADADNGLSVEFDFSGKVTSYSFGTVSSLRASSVDGQGTGALSSIAVNEKGELELAYSNDKKASFGAVALATFRDPQALRQEAGGLFTFDGSTEVQMLSSSDPRVGSVVSRRLEASNVDLSQEFGELILIQRGFQASSQIVSVANDMIQQLFGIRGQG